MASLNRAGVCPCDAFAVLWPSNNNTRLLQGAAEPGAKTQINEAFREALENGLSLVKFNRKVWVTEREARAHFIYNEK